MNLVIIEDSKLVLTQLLRLIAIQPRIKLVGMASDEEAAVAVILEKQPDVIMLDLALSPGSGIRVLERIREQNCMAKVMILTNNTGEMFAKKCEKLGAAGFYDKSEDANKCIDQLTAWLPPQPESESEQLVAMHAAGQLGTHEQEFFDNITRLAQTITNMPIVCISLLKDNKKWFISPDDVAMDSNADFEAFCAHALLRNELLEIVDTTLDHRFNTSAFVTGAPHIRFYAGVPIVLPSGEGLGTLNVLNTKPDALTNEQRDGLKTLAHSAMGEIELRHRLLHLEKEVERRKKAEARIHHLATRDPLTALPNRTAFKDRLDLQLKKSHRDNSSFAVMFIDLDRFKLINDTLGHHVGDNALMTVANRLTTTLRDSDTVARMGGDEFALIFPNIASEAEALEVTDKLIASLTQPFTVGGQGLHLGASIGVALYPNHAQTADQLLRHADLAMYQAKQSGGNRACMFSSQLDQVASSRMAIETNLHDAIIKQEFVVHYQPQQHLITKKLCGLEALVRWQHPQLGLIPPNQFVGLAEQRGLISQLGDCVLDCVLKQIKTWDAEAVNINKVAVNVSALELRTGFDIKIANALAHYGLAPSRIEIEITESALSADSVETMQVLANLRQMGVSVTLDDFGVGYSSLGQLRIMPIDALKIDKSFIDEIDKNTEEKAIVSAVITMANALGLRTIAEGAESASQVKTLNVLGCDCVQGYYVSKPVSATDIKLWLYQHNYF